MKNKCVHLTLCGGSGLRLWPLSQKQLPKQFLPLFNSHSSYQLALQRNQPFCFKQLVIAQKNHQTLSQNQAKECGQSIDLWLFEEASRNTAAAITLACLNLSEEDIVLVTPSDHIIESLEAYEQAVQRAIFLAKQGSIVTFGIRPTFAHSGYGYLKVQGDRVLSFHEKPDLKTAQEYLKDSNYLWNSGMFCFQVATYLSELKTYAPDLYRAAKEAQKKSKIQGNECLFSQKEMEAIEEISIDYALMEKTKKLQVVEGDFLWNDVGSFELLEKCFKQDEKGNTINDQVTCMDVKNTFVLSGGKKVVLIGVEDLIVVETEEGLLVAKKGQSAQIKEVLSQKQAINSP